MEYDLANTILNPFGFTHGALIPKGITIHYTADDNLERSIKHLKEKDLAYHLIIDRDGLTTQMAPLNKAVWHAGKARWCEQNPNYDHLAVSLVCWGELDQNKDGQHISWSGKVIDDDEVILAPGNRGQTAKSYWHMVTKPQIKSLVDFCLWTGLSPKFMCGHDEACIPAGRKRDPGGSLGMTMNQFRDMLRHKKEVLS